MRAPTALMQARGAAEAEQPETAAPIAATRAPGAAAQAPGAIAQTPGLIAATQAPGAAQAPGAKLFRGRTVEELIPKIEAELGSEAIVLRRRSGLEGGVGGFFQRPFVEIEAQRGSRIDVYDGIPETPAASDFATLDLQTVLERPSGSDHAPAPDAFAAALAEAGLNADRDPIRAAALAPHAAPDTSLAHHNAALPDTPFAHHSAALPDTPLAHHSAALPDTPFGPDAIAAGPFAADAIAPPERSPSKAERAVIRELAQTGIGERLAAELVADARAHVLPFHPRIGLRRAVKIALSRRVPSAAPLPTRGAAIAFIGPGGSGKTRCVAALSSAYRKAGEIQVRCASLVAGPEGDSMRMLLSPRVPLPIPAESSRALKALAGARADGLALLDTPPASPAEKGAIKELGRLLSQIAPDRIVVALPATLGSVAATQLLRALAPLKPDAIAITHADETDQLGVPVQAACDFGLAPEYLLRGSRGERALSRLDSAELADLVLR